MVANGDVGLNKTFWRCLQYSLGNRGVTRLLQFSLLQRYLKGKASDAKAIEKDNLHQTGRSARADSESM